MKDKLQFQCDRIEAVLTLHKVPAHITGGTVTPRWVRFTVLPAVGAKISRIKGLSEELAAALDITSCRVSRQGAAVSIEVPRNDPNPVRLLPLLRQLADQPIPPITAVLGLAEDGTPLLIRIPSPDVAHILVAGTTGSGKTVLLQAMIASLAMTNSPRDLAFVLIDPKGNAFNHFRDLPHLARPVITEVEETTHALAGLVHLTEQPERTAPTIVVVIDELADLIITSDRELHHALTRLTQRGRNAHIHIIAATQKPTAEVLGPLVKANFPVRLVGHVMSIDDARVAAGWSNTGAERLLGQGDFLAVAEGRVTRFQGAHISPGEIRQIAAQIAADTEPPSTQPLIVDVPDQDLEPSPDAMLARELISSPVWPDRHQPGFLTRACQELFGKPLAGCWYTRTREIVHLAEKMCDTEDPPASPAPHPPTPTPTTTQHPTRPTQHATRNTQYDAAKPAITHVTTLEPPVETNWNVVIFLLAMSHLGLFLIGWGLP